jgi:pyruvate dehydrogenase E2 component (dihydrolipoamide acetyltransferase)
VVPPANRKSDEKPAATPASVVSAAPEHHISPRALRVARELGIDWTRVTGTGRTGRIREQDIRTFADGPGTARPPSTLRQKIADRMVASLREGAPVTLHTTVDATRLVEWRTQLKSTAATAGNAAPSYTELLIHLTARALQQHPGLNARWDGRAFQPIADIHIGMAVDTEAGLLVPVLRQAHQLKLPELVTRARDLIERARTRRLLPDELRDGTFTITSLGAFGIDAFTPIINPPECAILGVGRIQKKPAVVDDQIVVRDLMTLSLTFDHRALDGAPAARFLQTLSHEIEESVGP